MADLLFPLIRSTAPSAGCNQQTTHPEESMLLFLNYEVTSPDPVPIEEAACCFQWHISPHGCHSLQYGNLGPQTKTQHCKHKI